MYRIELLSEPRRVASLHYELTLRITNLSDFAWTSAPDRGGINLAWWWCFQHRDANPRSFLFSGFEPRSSKVFTILIENPDETGRYSLHIDLVNEYRYWFRQRASGSLTVDVLIDSEGLHPWAQFQNLCVRLSALLPKQYPLVDRHSSRKTLLVESRVMPHLGFLIRNTVQKMGDGWGHVIYCSRDNHEQIRDICRDISPAMDIRLLDVDVGSDNDYNDLCLDAGFWTGLDCERVLVHQSDSILMKSFEEQFLRHDYIGANWGPGPHVDNIRGALGIEDDVVQGNGGLSLRSTRMLREALDDVAFRDRHLATRFSDTLERIPEDLYFSLYACRHGVYPRDSRAFAIEPSAGHKEGLEDGDDPFGYHKPYNFPDFERHLARAFRIRGEDALIDQQARVRSFSRRDYEVTRNDRPDRPVSVSLIIALCNYDDYIAECIRSVLEQTVRDLEIIVVNDASLDRSLEVARGFLPGEFPMTIIDKRRNTGVVHSRNLGIGFARGDYVFILDADNRLLPECIEAHLDAMRGTDCVAAYGIVKCFDVAGVLLHTLSDREFDPEALGKKNYIDAMAMFDRRKLIDLGCYDTGLLEHGPSYEDWELWLRIGSSGGDVRFIDKVLSHYVVKDDSLSARVRGLFHDSIVEYLRRKYRIAEPAPD